MSTLKCRKFIWSGMGARPNPQPSPQQLVTAKKWVNENICAPPYPAYRVYINQFLTHRMQKTVCMWANSTLASRKGGDLVFFRQDFLHNRPYAQKESDLWVSCLGPLLDQRMSWRVSQGHELKAFVTSLGRIDKEIDYTLGMIARGKNTYPTLGEKLMYNAVVKLSKMPYSVYGEYAPNIK